jgi:transcriptional regulator with XRE-family HTH domain
MSYLADAITGLMRQHELTSQVELARKANVDPGTLSRWINGLQTTISDQDLARLANAFSDEPKDHAKLVVARMLDVREGPGSELVSVHVDGRTLREDPQPYGVKLPPKGRETINLLASEYLADADLRDVLDGLANIIREGKLKPVVHEGGKAPVPRGGSPAPKK